MDSNVSNHYECEIKVLSPVHIGAGESYTLRECISVPTKSGKKLLKRIDLSAYYASLPNDRDKEKFLDELIKEDFSLIRFHNTLLEQEEKNNQFLKEENQRHEYADINSFLRYRGYDHKFQHQLDIFENVKTVDEVFIPGSSLKGAIRTALLYNSIDDDDISNYIKWNNRRKQDELDSNKLDKFLNGFFSEDKRNVGLSDDLKYLHVSDSNTFAFSTFYQANQIRVAYAEDGTCKGIEDGTKSFLETISFEDFVKTKSLTSNIDIEYNKDIIDKSKEKYLDIDYIKKSIYEFSKRLIEFELDFAIKFDLQYLIDFYIKMETYNTEETPLLRIGAGSGLMGTSLALKIWDYDPNVFRVLFKKTDGSVYPRTRRLVISQEKPEVEGVPLGWVQLDIKES